MIDSIKKTLLAGIGAAIVTKEKVESALDDFVRQGKVTAADARAMAEKIAAEGRQEFDAASARLGEKIKDLTSRRDAELEARLAALEARVAELEKASAPAAKP